MGADVTVSRSLAASGLLRKDLVEDERRPESMFLATTSPKGVVAVSSLASGSMRSQSCKLGRGKPSGLIQRPVFILRYIGTRAVPNSCQLMIQTAPM